MAKTTSVTLGGDIYEVPYLNIGQLEEASELIEQTKAGGLPKSRLPFSVVRLAFTRVEPAVTFADLAPRADEVLEAAQKILIAAGLSRDPAEAPQGETQPVAAG